MKRCISLLIFCFFVVSMSFTGCGIKGEKVGDSPTVTPDSSSTDNQNADKNDSIVEVPEVTVTPQDNVINIWCYGDELPKIMEKFKELHRDFGYTINVIDKSPICSSYQVVLEDGLTRGGVDAPDIYAVPSSYVIYYTQGKASHYATDYKELGIDVDTLIQEASIPQYSIDIGTNPEGKLVGLSYQSNTGAFIYRRSIAKDVWGTDDPTTIKETVGPGWDKFFSAAKDLKAKGYGICSSAEEIWDMVANTSKQGWVVDGKLVIDPIREEYMDLAMKFEKNDYSNHARSWTNEWYTDMQGGGEKQILGFFAPSWFIPYILVPNCGGEKVGEGTYGDWAVCEPPSSFSWGGVWVIANKESGDKEAIAEIIKWLTLDTSETGFQYLWANDLLGFGVKNTAPSSDVMKKSDGAMEFLSGQNMFDAYNPDENFVNGKIVTMYDETIDYYFLEQVQEYIKGNKTKEQAITDFKQQVAANLDVTVE